MLDAIRDIIWMAIAASFLVPLIMFLLAEVGLFEPMTGRQRNKRRRR